MRFFRIFKYKRQLKKFAKQNQIAEALNYIGEIDLTTREKQKFRRIIPRLFTTIDSDTLLLAMEVKDFE